MKLRVVSNQIERFEAQERELTMPELEFSFCEGGITRRAIDDTKIFYRFMREMPDGEVHDCIFITLFDGSEYVISYDKKVWNLLVNQL